MDIREIVKVLSSSEVSDLLSEFLQSKSSPEKTKLEFIKLVIDTTDDQGVIDSKELIKKVVG